MSVAAPRGLLVAIVDRQGKPVPGLDVRAVSRGSEVAQGTTDDQGDVRLSVEYGPVDVVARYNGHSLWKTVGQEEVARGETVVFDLPFCVRDPILKPIDIGLLLAAGALTGAGVYWKIQPLTTVGEVIFGATAFTIIYRLSCL
jgi:hypothetical protein